MKHLPRDFAVITLKPRHAPVFRNFINHNYVIDTAGTMQKKYSKKYMTWMFKTWDIILALVYKTRIVATITAKFIAAITSIDFLCVQKNMRNMGFGDYMKNYLSSELALLGKTSCIYLTRGAPVDISVRQVVVAINIPKLHKLGFIENIPRNVPKIKNKLDYMCESDIPQVVELLNVKQSVILYDADLVRSLCMPVPGVVFAYVVRDESCAVTGLVTAYKTHIKCLHANAIVACAYICYCFDENIATSDVFDMFTQKISDMNIDQVAFIDMPDFGEINANRLYYNDEVIVHVENFNLEYVPGQYLYGIS